MAPTIWVEVEDLFQYFAANPRPSGIQRLAFEIMRELVASGAPVRFARRGGAADLAEVTWQEVRALFARRATRPDASRVPPRLLRLRALWRRLPAEQHERVRRALMYQRESTRNVRQLLGLLRPTPPVVTPPVVTQPAATAPRLDGGTLPQAGDCLLVLGAPWAEPGFPEHLRALKQRSGVVVTTLFYDLIPVRHPEWCTRPAVAAFTGWLRPTLPLSDRLIAISRHTAADVEAFAREEGIVLPGPVAVVPVGTGFSDVEDENEAENEAGNGADDATPPGLPRPGSYVLFVGTVERRKNHALLVRVWRRLAEDVRTGRRSPASVPDLVFAGRVGWLVTDLMTQLDNTGWLAGRVRLIHDPTDAELRALYRGCLFTMQPSLFEGWGLPVTESLAAGKPCLAAGTTALPEAGGAVCRYFDPDDAGSAYDAVAALLDAPGGIAAWEDEVRRLFRPTPWADTSRAVLAVATGGAP